MDKPEEVFKAGAVQASIFMNKREIDGKEVEIPSINFQKSYKDEDDRWKTTSSLNVDDLPKAMLVLFQAYGYLMEAKDFD